MTVSRLAASLNRTVLACAVLIGLAVAVGVLAFRMSPPGALALYFVVWWTILFAVLPVGVRSQAEAGEVAAGSEPGAPAAPRLREKAIWTSLVAGFVFCLAVALLPLAGL